MASADYISREYVLKCMEDSYKNAGISAEAKAKMTRWLKNAPAADVRPVVRGKNIAFDYAECDQFVCSECGIELQDWHRVERDEDNDITYYNYVFRFCPNCGAWMEES